MASVLGAALLLVSILFLRMVSELKRTVDGLNGKLDRLEKRIASQEAQVAELRKALAAERNDPVLDIVNTVMGWRQKGLAQTLIAVGTRLFRSYWRGRGAKALPSPKEQ